MCYDWYFKKSTEEQFKKDLGTTGPERNEDGEYNQYFDNYLVVTGPDFSITSNILRVGKTGGDHNVTLLARTHNGEYLSSAVDYYIEEFTNPSWRKLLIGVGYNFWFFLVLSG